MGGGPNWRRSSEPDRVRSGRQAEGNDRVSARAGTSFELFEQARFETVRIRLHLASRNLLVGRSLKAEFADSQAVLGVHRRTEHAAGHGARLVEFAVSRLRVERRARLMVGEIGEPLLRLFSLLQNAADRVAGELSREAGHGFASPQPHPLRTLRSLLLKIGKSSPQAKGVELIDGESADTAGRASRAAHQPMPASAGHVGERGVDDLDQPLIARHSKLFRHLVRIAHPAISYPKISGSALIEELIAVDALALEDNQRDSFRSTDTFQRIPV